MSGLDSSMPNPLSNDSTKDSAEFGLKVIKDAYRQWKDGSGYDSYSVRKARYDYNIAFSVGKQPMDEYRDIIDVDGQLSVLNLDYSPLPIAIPLLNKYKDRCNQRIEKISCTSIDPFTQSKKDKAKSDALFKLKNKDAIQALEQNSGLQLEEFSDSDPEDEEEIDIQFGFNYKEREEVDMEKLIDIVFYDNKWSKVIKDAILDQIITCGFGVVKTYIDANGRIKDQIIKSANFISSYSEWNDLRDWEWQGDIDNMRISDIRLKYPDKVSEEELYSIAKSNAGKYGNGVCDYGWSGSWINAIARPYDGFRVQVVNLTYKTLYNLKYRKETVGYGREKLYKLKEGEVAQNTEISKPYFVSYTGCWIIDTKHLLEWVLSENMIKPEDNLVEILSPYSVYMHNNHHMTNTPLIETMIPSIKMMQHIHLRTQTLIATIAPDGSDIDVTGLSDIDMGDGIGIVSPLQLYGLYLQTGNRYFKGVEDSGEGARQPPIRPNQVPFSNKLEQLEALWQANYQKLLLIIGSNSLDQGQISNQAVGKGVLEDARQIGESSSNYIYNSYLNIMEEVAKKTQMLGWDILVYGKKGYDGYRQAIGTDNIEYLRVESSSDFEKTNFDVKIEAVLDDKAQLVFQQRINIALQQKEITMEDAIQAEELAKTNLKYAAQLFSSRIRKKAKKDAEVAMQNSQANTEAAIAAAQAKSQGDMELETLKAELASKREKETLETQKEMEVMKYYGIMKAEIIKATLSKEGSSIKDLPPFIFEGLEEVTVTQKELMAQDYKDAMIEAQMEEEALMQEQMAMEQQDMQQIPPDQQSPIV